VDKNQLEQLFTETETAAAAKRNARVRKDQAAATSKTASVLDNTRARNIEILLRAVKVDPVMIAKAIGGLNMDCGGLDYDSLTALRKQWPTAEERVAVQGKLDAAERQARKSVAKATSGESMCQQDNASRSGSSSQQEGSILTIAEKFVHSLAACPQVPRLSAKLSLAIFQSEFPSKAVRIDGWVKTVINACAQVRQSARFGTMLQVVLALGNTLNALGAGKASAAGGFRLSSLAVLANTKSFDDSTCTFHLLQHF
jgi:hypothetical protein